MAEELAATNGLNAFSLTLLRDRLLPEILQEDQNEITYWAGKSLARGIELHGIADIIRFFFDAGFGTLSIEAQNETEQTWHLTGEIVDMRLYENEQASFDLEAGFLAAQTQAQINYGAEAIWKLAKNKVIITVYTEVPATLPS